MNKEEKKELVSKLHEEFLKAESVIVTHYSGLDAAETAELRKKTREAGVRFFVTKNRLAKRALTGTKYEILEQYFTGPTAVAFSNDPISGAKIISNFSKDNEKLAVIAGGYAEQVLDKNSIENLAKIPPLEELRSKIVGMIQIPSQKLVTIIKTPANQVASVEDAYGKKQQ